LLKIFRWSFYFNFKWINRHTIGHWLNG
jgi:hypothetical protein